MCQIDVEWFPFDVQTCEMKFGKVQMLVSFNYELIIKYNFGPAGMNGEVNVIFIWSVNTNETSC